MKKRIVITSILILVVLGIVGGAYGYKYIFNDVTSSSRPAYCIDGNCINKEVFSKLPEYPKNFIDVYYMVYLGQLSRLEEFSFNYPDKSYYLQPEFYADSFAKQGVQYYTTKNIKFSGGSGPYPGDVVIQGANIGENLTAITYYHSSWAITKYQLMKLVPEFPEEAKTRMGAFVVNQDSEEAKSCLDIKLTPDNILLEPTSPYFYEGWVRKVVVSITPKCSGNWAVLLVPSDPDKSIEEYYLKLYGPTKLSTSRMGGAWQIFISVN